MGETSSYIRKNKNILMITIYLSVWSLSLAVALVAANVSNKGNKGSSDVLGPLKFLKAQPISRLISPLCVENGIRPKIFR